MPPELPNEQALVLKKRARRRLVGAVALVLLMVIILPQVLKDRAAMSQQEAIKITMPEANPEPVMGIVESRDNVVLESQHEAVTSNQANNAENNISPEPAIESVIATKEVESKTNEIKKAVPKVEKPLPVKVSEVKTAATKSNEKGAEPKKPEVKVSEVTPSQKSSEHFTVQVGVYSDVANVKRIQDQLKQAGFSTSTEKITTPKGESVRLKTGNFTSRQDAVSALGKLKELGLPGIVISNE
jgi:DedD protein